LIVTPLRVGWVSFVNILPLWHSVRDLTDIVIEEGVPTALNAKLASGEIDLAPISSIEYARHADRYALLPGLSISSDGPTRSVLVASDEPLFGPGAPEERGVVHLTPASATSVVLLKVLAAFAWPRAPGIEVTREPGKANARLLIGDEALRELLQPTMKHHVDLGQAWRQHTGLPMVFALFCARREALTGPRAEALGRVHRALLAAAAAPERELAAREAAARLELPVAGTREYLDGLSWDMSPRHEQGLQRFLTDAARLGECPDVRIERAAGETLSGERARV
jgi:chorismate dehydratase